MFSCGVKTTCSPVITWFFVVFYACLWSSHYFFAWILGFCVFSVHLWSSHYFFAWSVLITCLMQLTCFIFQFIIQLMSFVQPVTSSCVPPNDIACP